MSYLEMIVLIVTAPSCLSTIHQILHSILTFPIYCDLFCDRVYNCDVQGCPADNSMLTKDVYRRFNTEAVKLFVV